MFRSILGRRRAHAVGIKNSSNVGSTDALFEALVHYGMAPGQVQNDNLKAIYASAIRTTDRNERLALWPRLIDLLAEQAINPSPLLAMAICDPDPQIAGSCALDFVCFSPMSEAGRPQGILEFTALFPTAGAISNPGAVFGGLLALGDENLTGFYQETTLFLSDEDLQAASHSCRSGRIFHTVIDYWLWILENNIEDAAPATSSTVGYAAAAIVGLLQSASEEQVMLATREYPCTRDVRPLICRQVWTISDYADLIAPRLRAIAQREPPPCIMPDVLQAWNVNATTAAQSGRESQPKGTRDLVSPTNGNEDFFTRLQSRLEHGLQNGVSDEELALIAYHTLFAVGCGHREDFGPNARAVYEAAVRRLPVETRNNIVFSIVKNVSEAEIGAQPLVIILLAEPECSIALHVAEAMIIYTALDDECVSSGMTLLKRMVVERKVMNRGAAFGAAVGLGDASLRPQIREMLSDLSAEEIEIAALSESGQALVGTIDFWISLAEDTIQRMGWEAKSFLIPIGIALEVIRGKALSPTVVDIARPYPFPADAAVHITRQWGIDEYAASIGPRLYAIEGAETAPRVFSSVLKTWGLEPASPANEHFSYSDYYDARRAQAN